MIIRLVTDSTCDIPADLIARHHILVVPAIVNIRSQSYRDGLDLTRAEFYARLPTLTALPHTAAPAIGEFQAAYEQCGDAKILSIHMAAQLSGIYNGARLAAEPYGARVTLVDTGQLSMGLGWQVLAAAEAIAAGKTLPEVLAALEATRRRVKVFALLDTLEYLRRGGRASALTATLSQIFQIKLMVELRESQVIPVAKVRTHSKGLQRLSEAVTSLGALDRLAVLHAHALADAEALAARLAPHSAQPPLIVEATSVIGTHVGPQALGIAAVRAM